MNNNIIIKKIPELENKSLAILKNTNWMQQKERK